MVKVNQLFQDEEEHLYESMVHGLRSQGWSRSDAEAEAIERITARRERKSDGGPA